MVNTKVRGFDSPQQLREHLGELDDTPDQEPPQDRRLRQEIAFLRAQLEDLTIRAGEGWPEVEDRQRPAAPHSPLASLVLPVTAVLGFAFVLALRASRRRTLFLHR